jgi:DNA polymerase/3'-5' exonuclease PolX
MKEKRPYIEGLKAAMKLEVMLGSACERIEIAGSIRRRRAVVGDIELVAIPRKRWRQALFGEAEEKETWLDMLLRESPAEYQLIQDGPRKKLFLYRGFPVDLFLTDEAQWGVVYTLRTGSVDFSKWLVTSRLQGGARRVDRFVRGCRVWAMGEAEPLSTPEEPHVFHALGVPWVPLEMRDRGYWGTDMTSWRPGKRHIGSCFKKASSV